jgi:hypothetical protein
MHRGRVYKQVPVYDSFPDFNPKFRAPLNAHFEFSGLPLGTPGFVTPITTATWSATTLDISWTGYVTVGPRTYQWAVLHHVNDVGPFVQVDFLEVDDLGNGTLAQVVTSYNTQPYAFGSPPIEWLYGDYGRIGTTPYVNIFWQIFCQPYH